MITWLAGYGYAIREHVYDMGQVEFTVVIPVHNKERHAARSLQSVLAQSFTAREIVIVDDASTDQSISCLREIANDRTVFLRRDEPGPGGYAARNLAIERGTSEWIAFLDADDTWAPDHLRSIAFTIERSGPGASCVFTGYEFLEPAGYRKKDWFSQEGHGFDIFDNEDMIEFWIRGGCPLWTGAVAIRRELLLRVGMFPAGLARRGGDRDLWLRTMLATKCAYSGSVSATYHRDADNMLTRAESFSVRQRIQDTITQVITDTGTNAMTAARLRRLSNREVFQYAFKAWKGGADITAPMLDGFSVLSNPLKYILIQMMRAIPLPLSQSTRAKIGAKLDSRRKRLTAAR